MRHASFACDAGRAELHEPRSFACDAGRAELHEPRGLDGLHTVHQADQAGSGSRIPTRIRTVISSSSCRFIKRGDLNELKVSRPRFRRLNRPFLAGSISRTVFSGIIFCTSAFLWHRIRGTGVAPLWLDAVRHRLAIPKCSFLLWLALKNRLFTKDRMINMGMNVNPMCVLCSTELESVMHIYGTWSFVKCVLQGSVLSEQWPD